MLRRARARFRGSVQGVYFRHFTQKYSTELGVCGWVMNLDDGSVQAVFEGEEENILEVIKRLREEHPLASVEEVNIDWQEYRGEFENFWIRSLER